MRRVGGEAAGGGGELGWEEYGSGGGEWSVGVGEEV